MPWRPQSVNAAEKRFMIFVPRRRRCLRRRRRPEGGIASSDEFLGSGIASASTEPTGKSTDGKTGKTSFSLLLNKLERLSLAANFQPKPNVVKHLTKVI